MYYSSRLGVENPTTLSAVIGPILLHVEHINNLCYYYCNPNLGFPRSVFTPPPAKVKPHLTLLCFVAWRSTASAQLSHFPWIDTAKDKV